MEELKYCLCCGEQVPCNVVVRHGRRELNCVFCGFTLDSSNLEEPPPQEPSRQPVSVSAAASTHSSATQSVAASVTEPLNASATEPVAASHQMSQEGYALVADDSRYTRKIIEALLKEKHYSSHVKTFENGLELLTAYSKLLAEKKLIDIAIIDLNMPVMDGLTAARMIRALESRNNASGVPIVFFSAEKCGQDLKQQMETLEPANYVNKGSDPDPDKLTQRIEFLLTYLSENYKEQPA
ncbi:MAG: response regulator [Thermodesulfovibrionales bacterium]